MADERATIPFWAHQSVEYLLGFLLVLVALGMPRSATLVIAGAALILAVAALTDGPLGCWKVLGRAAHRAADFAVIAVFAAAPLLLHRHDPEVWIVAEATAAGLAVMARSTQYVKPAQVAKPSRRSSPPTSPSAPPPAAKPSIAPIVARRVGDAMGRLGKDGPRALGRAVGKRRANREGDSQS